MGPYGVILKGDYKGGLSTRGFTHRTVVIQEKFKAIKDVNSETVDRIEVMSEKSTKGATQSALGGMFFGTTGAIVGQAATPTKKEIMVGIYFKDNTKILVKCNQSMFELLQTAIF